MDKIAVAAIRVLYVVVVIALFALGVWALMGIGIAATGAIEKTLLALVAAAALGTVWLMRGKHRST